LEFKGDKVFVALNEDEVFKCLNSNKIDVILIEPLLGTDFLSNKEERVMNIIAGGIGIMLLNNIQKVCTQRLKIILYTTVSLDNLCKVATQPERVFHFRKPEYIETLIAEIHRRDK
jgi:hypothetical protein